MSDEYALKEIVHARLTTLGEFDIHRCSAGVSFTPSSQCWEHSTVRFDHKYSRVLCSNKGFL